MTQPVGKRPSVNGQLGDRSPEGRRRTREDDRRANTMVLATIGSVVIAVALGVGVLSPLLFSAAVFPFFYRALCRGDHRSAVVLVFRWGVALFLSLLAVGVFIPHRLGAALPLSSEAIRTLESWIREPESSPPADTGYLLWGMLAFLAASVASGGLIGFIIGAGALGGAAIGALFVFRHGLNLLQIALVALPVWQLSAFVAGAFLLVPSSVFVFERFFHIERRMGDWQRLRQYMYAGAGFFALSILLRYTAAGAWRSLVERWTVL